MRIAVVTTSFPRTPDDPSGHFVRSACEALARAGHDVHVVAPGGSPFDRPRQSDGLTLHPAGAGTLFGWPGALARTREAPWRALAAGPFAAGVLARLHSIGPVDRAIAHWIVPCAWPLLAMTRPPALEAVAHGADVCALLAAPERVRSLVLESLLGAGASFSVAAASSLDALTAALPLSLAARLVAAARVEPPSIDVPDLAARGKDLRASLDLAPAERVAVVACRLVPSKRVGLAIAAIAALRRHRAPVRLVVVGDGPERDPLARRAAALDLAVRFTGALPRREALGWLAGSDVLVHPSSIEAAPTVVREARALGVPVVACDAGDVARWAERDRGIAIAAPSAERIADAIAAALEA